MEFLEIIIVVVTTIMVMIIYKTSRSSDTIPSPPTLPLIGNVHMIETDDVKYHVQLLNIAKEFSSNRIAKLMLGIHPFILVFKPDSMEKVLSSSKLITKSYFYQFLHPWLKTGLLTSTGKKWHRRRKMLTPTFHFRFLRDFMHIFNEQAEILVAKWAHLVDGEAFDIVPHIKLCTLDIICDTAMGKNMNTQRGGNHEYVTSIATMGETIMNRVKEPWIWPDAIFRFTARGKRQAKALTILHRFTSDVIRQRKSELEELWNNDPDAYDTFSNQDDDQVPTFKGRKRLAFLDLLLSMARDDPNFGEADIQEEVDTFMFEGHDTTASAMTWALHLIGANPDVQRKVYEELDSIFGNSQRPVEHDDLKQLKYMSCVMKEALRIFPAVPWVARELTEDVELEGHIARKGSTAALMFMCLHMDEDLFPDPDVFDPDRFLPENVAGRHPFAYVPFSAGPRNCIGQKFAKDEEKVVLASILRRFEIESQQKTVDMEPVNEMVLQPNHGAWVKLRHRATSV